jgi:predicted MFS family arabinose efflux permease
VVTDALGWRWVFGLTAPPVAVLLALTFLLVPPDRAGRRHGRVDLPGALSATAGLLCLVFALTNAGDTGWAAPTTLIALSAGIALLALFLGLQARVREPLMPLRVWTLPNFAPVMAIAFCLYASWTGVIFFLALTLQNVLGYSPTEAALALLPIAIGGYIGSTLAGRLLPRTGPRHLLTIGLSLYVAGIVLMAFIDGRSDYWFHIFAAVTLAIAGNSLTFVSSTVTALAHSGADEESLVGGLFNTGVQVGGGLGLAVMSAVAATRIDPGASGEALLAGRQRRAEGDAPEGASTRLDHAASRRQRTSRGQSARNRSVDPGPLTAPSR